MERLRKRVCDSRTEQVHIVMPQFTNGQNRLFGGALMEWVDVVAGVVARRHSGCNVTTAAVDPLSFLAPARLNDMILSIGEVTYVGRTSMEVRVDTFVESLEGARELVNRAYLVMVAVGEDEKPVEIPGLILETEEQELEWRNGEQRRAIRDERSSRNA